MDLISEYLSQSALNMQGQDDYMEYTETDTYNDEYDALNDGDNWGTD